MAPKKGMQPNALRRSESSFVGSKAKGALRIEEADAVMRELLVGFLVE
jgi:hypothetical protein